MTQIDTAALRALAEKEGFYRWEDVRDLCEEVERLRVQIAAAWEEGRASVALDFTRPLGEDGQRPATRNPYAVGKSAAAEGEGTR